MKVRASPLTDVWPSFVQSVSLGVVPFGTTMYWFPATVGSMVMLVSVSSTSSAVGASGAVCAALLIVQSCVVVAGSA